MFDLHYTVRGHAFNALLVSSVLKHPGKLTPSAAAASGRGYYGPTLRATTFFRWQIAKNWPTGHDEKGEPSPLISVRYLLDLQELLLKQPRSKCMVEWLN